MVDGAGWLYHSISMTSSLFFHESVDAPEEDKEHEVTLPFPDHFPITNLFKVRSSWDFPGGTVVKNPPANAGDTGSSPGPGRSHMPRSN